MNVKKNPLSIVLGIYLNEERKKNISGSSVKEIISKSKLGESIDSESTYSESLYRMVESGNARIHPKHLFEYIRMFDGSNIKVEPFCQLIIAIQFLDSFMDDDVKFKKAFAYLKRNGNEKYEALLEAMTPYLKDINESGTVMKEKMVKDNAVTKLRLFLSSETYEDFGKPTQKIQEVQILNEVPSIYYGFIDKFIKNLLELPITISGKSLWKWEDTNHDNLEYLYAICKDLKAIISEENFSRYKYKYLIENNSNFKEAHIIFTQKGDPAKLKDDFCRLLEDALRKEGEEEFLKDFSRKMEKVHIYCVLLPDEKIKEIFSAKDVNNPNKTIAYNIAWGFKLNTNHSLGFKTMIDKDTWAVTEAFSLTVTETDSLIEEIKDLIPN